MKRSSPLFTLQLLIVSLCVTCWCSQTSAAQRTQTAASELRSDAITPLDTYVHAPDTNYGFHLVASVPGQHYTAFVLEMTSQAWLTTNEVDRPVWTHWLTLIKPNDATNSTALLFISGGANDGGPPASADPNLTVIAVGTHCIVAELKMVPNQPLIFAGETQGRKEDALIAYTWDKFLRTGDSKWPARLPMTKAAVRAMDTLTAFCAGPEGGKMKVDRFVVAGGSKRGWTTWTTAAVDKRVVAIIPVVIDILNVEASMMHHYGAYGFWAPAIHDYNEMHIMDWTGTPEFHALMKIEDPYTYRSRFTMPKFLINAAADQFFLPDSSQFYFADLPGVKYLRYVPNADHSLRGSDAYKTVAACFNAVVYQSPLPKFSWTLEGENALKVTATDPPSEVKLWQATNPDARDFRLDTFGPKWRSTPLTARTGNTYLAEVPKPEKGWTAFFAELTFPTGNQNPFKFTTEIRVTPDELPFKFTPKSH